MSKVKTALAVVAGFPIGAIMIAGVYTWACMLTGDYGTGRALYDAMENFEKSIN